MKKFSPKTYPRLSFYTFSRSIDENIRQIIAELYPVCDELVIALSQPYTIPSTLKDPEKKIFFYEHAFSSFGEMRNFALSKTTGDWIITLDSDERFSPTFLKNVRSHIKNKSIGGYKIHRIHFYGTKHQVFDPFTHLRLFRKTPKLRYIGKVHELIDGVVNPKSLRSRRSVIYHLNSYNEMKRKNQEYRKILQKEYEAAVKSGNKTFIDLATFRLWANSHVDNQEIFYNTGLQRKINAEFKIRLKKLLGHKKHYHEDLEQLDSLVS